MFNGRIRGLALGTALLSIEDKSTVCRTKAGTSFSLSQKVKYREIYVNGFSSY